MIITDGQIADACNKAYLKAGHNAYFGNGFQAGVEFALEKSKSPEMFDMLKRFLEITSSFNHPKIDHLRGSANQLIKQATTI